MITMIPTIIDYYNPLSKSGQLFNHINHNYEL